jgi:hypothetical protein
MRLQPSTHAGSSIADFFYPEVGGDTFSETSVNTVSTWRHIPEDSILRSHRRENLKSHNMNVNRHYLKPENLIEF